MGGQTRALTPRPTWTRAPHRAISTRRLRAPVGVNVRRYDANHARRRPLDWCSGWRPRRVWHLRFYVVLACTATGILALYAISRVVLVCRLCCLPRCRAGARLPHLVETHLAADTSRTNLSWCYGVWVVSGSSLCCLCQRRLPMTRLTPQWRGTRARAARAPHCER